MGIAWCDYNNDGWEDVYVTNIDTGGFYKNNGDGTFTDITRTCGAAFNGMSWGVVFPDLDNDGDEDCFIANMYGFDSRPSLLYENVNGAFQNISAQANAALTCGSYGCASGDFNNDGYEDILVTNFNNPPGQNILLMNSRTKTGHWMKLKLQGTTINRMAIGTKVRVVAGGKSQIRIVDGGSSYCSQISPTLHFGLANSTIIDTIEIFWRQGYTQRFTHLMADTTYSITEGLIQTAVVDEPANMRRPRTETLFQNYPNPFNPETHFRFQISNAGFVSLKLFDLLGREVETVVSEELPAGLFTRTWDAGEVSGGVYYVKLVVVDARGQLITQNVRKVIVMK